MQAVVVVVAEAVVVAVAAAMGGGGGDVVVVIEMDVGGAGAKAMGVDGVGRLIELRFNHGGRVVLRALR